MLARVSLFFSFFCYCIFRCSSSPFSPFKSCMFDAFETSSVYQISVAFLAAPFSSSSPPFHNLFILPPPPLSHLFPRREQLVAPTSLSLLPLLMPSFPPPDNISVINIANLAPATDCTASAKASCCLRFGERGFGAQRISDVCCTLSPPRSPFLCFFI